MTPCIVGAADYQVHVDSCKVLQKRAVSFKSAAEAWFASFWILSLEYPKKIAKTCEFIENNNSEEGGKAKRYCSKMGKPSPIEIFKAENPGKHLAQKSFCSLL